MCHGHHRPRGIAGVAFLRSHPPQEALHPSGTGPHEAVDAPAAGRLRLAGAAVVFVVHDLLPVAAHQAVAATPRLRPRRGVSLVSHGFAADMFVAQKMGVELTQRSTFICQTGRCSARREDNGLFSLVMLTCW